MASSSVSFWILLITVCSTDGFRHYVTDACHFNSTELKDIEFIRSYHYNKLEFLRFSSSLDKYVGYTELGVKNAERLNKDKAELSAMRAQKERYCLNHVGPYSSNILSKSGELILTVNQTDQINRLNLNFNGEKISCVVEHASLKDPLRTDWDPSMPESERNKIAIGASGLVLGLVLSLAGFIYYKRKARGQ
uniref:H-2 class II histocompatibility antigen, E-D beta chain-like n=1 Tax=Acanthochromis polyacanthus TaxID=80966 RepID=A0A3Q1GYB3_9TELE